MEIEYKWDLAKTGGPAALNASEIVSPYITGARNIAMHAIYYDTAEGLTKQLRAGLRLRKENDRSVCCLKLPVEKAEGLAKRREYEVGADDIHEGLKILPNAGAPREVCDRFLASDLVVLCETEFTRRAFAVSCDAKAIVDSAVSASFDAELAVDAGVFRREGREQEFHEMEFEFKGGSENAFHAMAKRIQDAGRLDPQPLSKLARALQV